MKKIVLFILFFSLVFASGCKIKPEQDRPSDDVPITETEVIDDIGNYDISYDSSIVNTNYFSASTVQELIDFSDYIIIASTDVLYRDTEQKLLDFMANPIDDFEKADLIQSYSVRPFTVKEVIKGDKRERIDLCQNIVVKDNRMRVFCTEYPIQAGDDYILFLKRANGEREMYCLMPTQGAYNLDFEKNIGQQNMGQDMAFAVKEYYSEYFK